MLRERCCHSHKSRRRCFGYLISHVAESHPALSTILRAAKRPCYRTSRLCSSHDKGRKRQASY